MRTGHAGTARVSTVFALAAVTGLLACTLVRAASAENRPALAAPSPLSLAPLAYPLAERKTNGDQTDAGAVVLALQGAGASASPAPGGPGRRLAGGARKPSVRGRKRSPRRADPPRLHARRASRLLSCSRALDARERLARARRPGSPHRARRRARSRAGGAPGGGQPRPPRCPPPPGRPERGDGRAGRGALDAAQVVARAPRKEKR